MADARLELDLINVNNPFTDRGTLLDHFAGLAMQTVIQQNPNWSHMDVAEESYKQAWAMLKVRHGLDL